MQSQQSQRSQFAWTSPRLIIEITIFNYNAHDLNVPQTPLKCAQNIDKEAHQTMGLFDGEQISASSLSAYKLGKQWNPK